MTNSSRVLLLLAGALWAVPRPASTQSPPVGTVLAWGTVNVFLVPDSARGLRYLSAVVPANGRRGVAEKGFEDDFNPDSALRWSTQIDALLAGPVPDTGPVILSAMLKGRRGGVLAFAVRRAARHREPELDLVEFTRGRQPFRIQLTRNTATDLSKGVREQAPQAGWVPALPPTVIGAVEVPESLAHVPNPFTPPEVTSGPGLIYPASRDAAGETGAVWATFVVDTTGHADPSTVQVIYSTHADFTASVRVWLSGARFHPAQLGGRPIRAMMEMPFTFFLY